MRRTLVFENVVFDRVSLPSHRPIGTGESLDVFGPIDDGVDNKVVDVNEDQLLRFLLAKAPDQLLSTLGYLPNAFVDFSVKEPVRTDRRHPDFDLIICEPERPQFTTAIQGKRVKVQTYRDHKDHINKLPGLGEVVKQAKLQPKKYGFHRNYIAILIQIFDRERETVSEDIGILFIKFVQPTGKPYTESGSIGICLDNPPFDSSNQAI